VARVSGVQKAVDLTGSGPSVEDAVAEAVDRAGMTLDGITRFELVALAGSVDEGRLTYEAHVRVWFTLLERVHG
jgi:flavin-binding protein dodecin